MWRPIDADELRGAAVSVLGDSMSETQLSTIGRELWTSTGRPFRFDARAVQLGQSLVMISRQSGLRLKTLPGRRTGLVVIGFILDGFCDFGPASAPGMLLSRGKVFVLHDRANHELTASSSTRVLTIHVPARQLRDRGVDLSLGRYRGGSDLALGLPIRDFALAIVKARQLPSPSVASVVERVLLDLVTGMLLDASAGPMGGEESRERLRRRALFHIRDQHRNRALTPRSVAAALGASLRSLQRAFEGSGATAAEAIAEHRTETAALLLSTPGASASLIDEVARRSGFSPFELRTAMKLRYGMLPSEYRSAAANALTTPRRPHDY